MKCITLHQPFGQLILDGSKWIESRDWHPSRALLGKRIGIHAGAAWGKEQRENAKWYGYPMELPRGAVLCTAKLAGWFYVRHATEVSDRRGGLVYMPTEMHYREGEHLLSVPHDQCCVSFLGVGRCGWILRDVRPYAVPVPARGYQKFWTWNSSEGA